MFLAKIKCHFVSIPQCTHTTTRNIFKFIQTDLHKTITKFKFEHDNTNIIGNFPSVLSRSLQVKQNVKSTNTQNVDMLTKSRVSMEQWSIDLTFYLFVFHVGRFQLKRKDLKLLTILHILLQCAYVQRFYKLQNYSIDFTFYLSCNAFQNLC